MRKNSNRKRAYKFLKEGIRLDGLKEDHKAIAPYDKVIELLPNDHAVYHNKALNWGSLGKNELALECFDIAMDLNPVRYEEMYCEVMKEAD